MEIFQREERNKIEGINIRKLDEILVNSYNDDIPKVDSVVLDTILLDNNTKIKCIKNYYSNMDNSVPKKIKSNNTCSAVQMFYKVTCRPYECVNCHRIMLSMRKNKQVKPR